MEFTETEIPSLMYDRPQYGRYRRSAYDRYNTPAYRKRLGLPASYRPFKPTFKKRGAAGFRKNYTRGKRATSVASQKQISGPSTAILKDAFTGYGGNFAQIPPKHYGVFQYIDPSTSVKGLNLPGTAGHVSVTTSYTANTLYQVFASTTALIGGLTEWSSLYSNYRVNGIHVEVDFINDGGVPIVCYVICNPDQGSTTIVDGSTTYQQIMGVRGLRGVAMATLGNNSNNPSNTTLVLDIPSFAKHFGDPQFNTAAGYAASFGANPASLFAVQIGFVRLDGLTTALSNACYVDTRIKFLTCIFNADYETS